MAWGKSEEERQKEQAQKELDKQEKRDQKQQEELQKLLSKYHVKDIDERDLESVQSLDQNMLHFTGWAAANYHALSSPVKGLEDRFKIDLLEALFRQNWIIIQQLTRINKGIEALVNKGKE